MYKIIIVDDEEMVCRLLLQLAHWDELNISVAAVCHDGWTALEKVKEIQPDIVLTDIRIPGLDGLQLINQAISSGCEAEFIVISGYKYFEYAYHAMRVGVVDYLLKPIEEKALNDTLLRTCRMIEEKRNKKRYANEISLLAENGKRAGKVKFLWDLVYEKRLELSSAQEVEERYLLNFPFDTFLGVVIRGNQNFQMEDTLFESKVSGIGERIFSDNQIFVMASVGSVFVCVLNFKGEDGRLIDRKMNSFFYDLSVAAKNHGNMIVTMGTGTAVPLRDLPKSVQEAKEAEEAKIVCGNNRMIRFSEQKFRDITLEQLADSSVWRQLSACLDALNAEELKSSLDKLKRRFTKFSPVPPKVVFDFLEEFMLLLRRAYAEIGEEEFLGQIAALETECHAIAGIEEFFQLLTNRVGILLEKMQTEKNYLERKPIRFAKAYIAEHYSEPLCLESVAEEIGLNPSYFSTLFKKICNQSFVEYLTGVRIRVAKELLRSTELSNTEIALRIGYSSDKYFIRVFKKETGVRPNDYRRLYS